jgi:hypothetical protein
MSVEELLAGAINEGPSDEQLKSVMELAERQLDLERLVEEREASLSDVKRKLQQLKTEALPDAMATAGIASFTLTNGKTVEVSPFYSASIPKDRHEEAMKWLEEHGHDSIVKVEVQASFGKNEYAKALELARELDELGYPCVPVMSVHHTTVKAWVRAMSESNQEFPMDLFGAFIGNVTKIK